MEIPIDITFFFTSVLIAATSYSLIAKWYLWPRMRAMPFKDAVRPLLVLNTFRYVGFGFLIPGVVVKSLPAGFANPGAYGDIVASVLAFICLALLNGNESVVKAVIWIFNIQGTVDILSAMFLGPHFGIDPGDFGSMYFITTVYVPAVFVSHLIIYKLLVRKPISGSGWETPRG